MNVLECVGLSKAYKKKKPVLDHFNLTIPDGKIVGLLGPNGCGKSTLMKLISGLLTADDGNIYVCGNPVGDNTRALISYLPERTYFRPQQRVCEVIEYFSDFYADFDKDRANELLDKKVVRTRRFTLVELLVSMATPTSSTTTAPQPMQP